MLVVYDNNWMERERNTKMMDEAGVKTPLVKELGKTWYVRLPDSKCKEARDFPKPRLIFWDITREAWDEELKRAKTWTDAKTPNGQPSRYEQIADMEETWIQKDLSSQKPCESGSGEGDRGNADPEISPLFRRIKCKSPIRRWGFSKFMPAIT